MTYRLYLREGIKTLFEGYTSLFQELYYRNIETFLIKINQFKKRRILEIMEKKYLCYHCNLRVKEFLEQHKVKTSHIWNRNISLTNSFSGLKHFSNINMLLVSMHILCEKIKLLKNLIGNINIYQQFKFKIRNRKLDD